MGFELTDFLTRRRGRIPPRFVGLSSAKIRRTKGLTREDMAELAGVSFKWYTLFESGATKGVSRKLAERVATVLGLNPAERYYLFGLLGFAPDTEGTPADNTSPDGLIRLLHRMAPVPAALCSPLFDVIDCNERFASLFPPPDLRQGFGTNMLWRLFMDAPYRAAWADWPAVAERTVAEFKYFTAYLRKTPEFSALRAALEAHEEFLPIWNSDKATPLDHPVARFALVVPNGRRIEVETMFLRSLEAPGAHLCTLVEVGEGNHR